MFQSVKEVSAGAMRETENERRQTLKLLFYWDRIRAERLMPVEDDIDPDNDAIADLWPNCFLVQVRDLGARDFNYTYLGPSIMDAYRTGLEAEKNPHIVSLSAAKLVEYYRALVKTRRPLVHEGEFVDDKGRLVKFRQCLLPLGKTDVDVIFGHMTHRIYQDMAAA